MNWSVGCFCGSPLSLSVSLWWLTGCKTPNYLLSLHIYIYVAGNFVHARNLDFGLFIGWVCFVLCQICVECCGVWKLVLLSCSQWLHSFPALPSACTLQIATCFEVLVLGWSAKKKKKKSTCKQAIVETLYLDLEDLKRSKFNSRRKERKGKREREREKKFYFDFFFKSSLSLCSLPKQGSHTVLRKMTFVILWSAPISGMLGPLVGWHCHGQ